jgi:ribosomal-protein-alanine N-acetyltransferase
MAARASSLDPSSLEVHLVPMRRRHLRSVLRIEAQVYPRPWSLSLFLSELSLRTSRYYVVARVDGVVVGYAGLMYTGDDGHVTTIAVDPAWQRAKIGTRLLLELARAALEQGSRNLTLEVRVGNHPAQALYEQFGFAPAGIRKNYYVETNEDALVMWAEHIDDAAFAQRLAAIDATLPGTTVVGELGRP